MDSYRKSSTLRLASLLVFATVLASAAAALAWPVVHVTGTTYYNPDKAESGYLLYSPMDFKAPNSKDETYNDGVSRMVRAVLLINMKGAIVHVWEMPFDPIAAHLLPNSHLVVIGYDGKSTYSIPGTAGKLVEFDWDGKQVFEHEDLAMHHSVKKLPNGNYIYLSFEEVPKVLQKRVRGGIKGTEGRGGVMLGEHIVEINPQGKIVWEWHGNAHLDPDIDIIGPLYKREEWLHGNSLEVLANGNIAMTSRHTDCLYIIDKKSGKIIQRWGIPNYLDKATGRIEYQDALSKVQYIGGPHDVRQIPADFPGGGNLTVYDNGMYTNASRTVELNPAEPQPIWFSKQPGYGRRQFSNFSGSSQRLANGNTLMCEGSNGRFVQITPENEVVWEYINPYVPSQIFQGAVLKVDQYEPDYCSQFKKLPPAEGPAIMPPDNDKLKVDKLLASTDNKESAPVTDAGAGAGATGSSTDWGTGAKIAVVALVTGLLAFLGGRRSVRQ